MKIISEYRGDGEFIDREACVKLISDGVMHVELYDEMGLMKICKLTGKTVQQAEDLAEDWVMGETN
jgi:hypothetical protein